MFRNIGRGATWYVPAVIGLYNVAEAPPQTRMRTLFEEGFGILGGVAGTQLGVSAGIGLVAVLGLGPMGLFIAVFLCATAGGIAGNELLRKGARAFYDFSKPMEEGVIFNSQEQFLESIN